MRKGLIRIPHSWLSGFEKSLSFQQRQNQFAPTCHYGLSFLIFLHGPGAPVALDLEALMRRILILLLLVAVWVGQGSLVFDGSGAGAGRCGGAMPEGLQQAPDPAGRRRGTTRPR